MSSSTAPSTEQVSQHTFLAVTITLTCIAGLFVVARSISSWQRKPKRHVDHIDDYITIVALLFLIASVVSYNELVVALSDPTTSLDSLMRLSHALTWIGALMLWGCKVPVLVLYVTLFGVKTWLKISSYAIIAVTGTIFLIVSAFVTARCNGDIEDPMFLPRCQSATTRSGFALGLVSVLTDGLIFALPIPVIARLHLPIHKKIGISAIFAGGLVAIAASAVSTSYKWKSLKWSSSGGTNDMICTIVESSIALMVASAPALYGLWTHNRFTINVYSRISSAVSQLFLVRSKDSTLQASGEVELTKSRPSTGSMKQGLVNEELAVARHSGET